MSFSPDPATWFRRVCTEPALRDIRLTSQMALEAALLSGIHADPADRFLIATAKVYGIPLLTSDTRIIAYGAQGILNVIPCRPLPDQDP